MSAEYYDQYWSSTGFAPLGILTPGVRRVFANTIKPGDRCLDLGCGDGHAAGPWIMERGGDYLGVDVAEGALARARARGLAVQPITDASSLPFPDARFDVIVSLELLEHVFDPLSVVREAHRVLRPGGAMIVSVPNVAYWRRRLESVVGRWNPVGDHLSVEQPWRDPHIRFFTQAALHRLFVSAGFTDVRVGGHGGALLRDLPYLRRLVQAGPEGSSLYQRLERWRPSLFAATLHGVAYGRKEQGPVHVAG